MATTTYKLDEARREKVKDAAFKISWAIQDQVSMTNVIKKLIDDHLDDFVERVEKSKEFDVK
jgi:hypothetical protein